MRDGELLAHTDPESLVADTDGRVYEYTTPRDELSTLREQYQVSSTVQQPDGVRVRGDTIDMSEEGVYEPLRVKTQAIESATEAAVMLLRIDDVIAAAESQRRAVGKTRASIHVHPWT